MLSDIIIEVRRKILAGEDVPKELLRKAIAALREERASKDRSSATKSKPSHSDASQLLRKLLNEDS